MLERRFIDSSVMVKDTMPGTDFCVDIPPVHKNGVKLIAKRNSSDFSMVNGFLHKAINKQFTLQLQKGSSHVINQTYSNL